MDDDLVQALRLRGVDVETALEVGMINRPEAEHLAHASAAGRVIHTLNVGDFMQRHGEYMAAGGSHGGITFGNQQRYSVGEQMRRRRRIVAIRPAEALQNSYEFLSAWQ